MAVVIAASLSWLLIVGLIKYIGKYIGLFYLIMPDKSIKPLKRSDSALECEFSKDKHAVNHLFFNDICFSSTF
jgi:hypothetical protein